jgi:hypothetical protein
MASQKRRSFNTDFSRRNRQKTNGARSVGVGPEFDTLYFVLKKILEQNRPVCWGIVARRNHMLVPHISGHFLLTASMYNSLSSSNSCKLLQQIPGTF